MVEGFIHGVEHLASKVASTLKNVVEAPINAIKSVLGIGSPSKVTEKHGEGIAEGYAEGMKKGLPHVMSVAQQIVAFFQEHGLSKAQAAGIAGNAALESSYDPNAPGGGLFQTIGGRGVPQGSSVQSQLQSAWKEMLARGEVSGIKGTGSPEEAARFFESNFERPAGYNLPGEGGTAHSLQRQAAARAALGGAAGGPSSTVAVAEQKAALDKEVAQQKAALAEWVAKMTAEEKGASASRKAEIQQEIATKKAETAQIIANEKSGLSVQQATQKAELQKQTSDQKTGTSLLNKMLEAVHSGSLKTLSNTLEKVHLAGLAKVEHDLDSDHKAALAKLSAELVKVHTEALKKQGELEAKATREANEKAAAKAAEAAQKAAETAAADQQKAAEAAEKATVDALNKQASGISEEASDRAQQIADATKITLDQQAEAGLSGAGLIAAQLQTSLDQLTERENTAIGQAKLEQLGSSGLGSIAEAQAAKHLAEVEGTAKVREAEAQSKEELAAKAAGGSSTTNSETHAPITVYINGSTLSAQDVLSEVGWALKTGTLPTPTVGTSSAPVPVA